MLTQTPDLLDETITRSEDIVLIAEGITKVFPGTVALDNVTFQVRKGKVNVLIGENGAGKSTLMKILAGVERPTHGKIMLDGKEIHLHSPLDATRLGIGIIYQELNLCANLSVVDNIFLAREITTNGVINKKEETQKAIELIKRLEQNIDPRITWWAICALANSKLSKLPKPWLRMCAS